MTVDLATLAIRVDSTQAEEATRDLDRLTQAGQRTESAQKSLTQATGQTRAGMQQLSYQIGDVATMYALGARPMQIFASQGTQVIQAVQMMTSAKTGLLGVLAGPWGIAMTAAVTVLGSLGAAYLSAERDANSFTDALREQETQADRAADALGRLRGLRRASTEEDVIRLVGQRSRIQTEIDSLLEANRNDTNDSLSGGRTRTANRNEEIMALRRDLLNLNQAIRDGNQEIERQAEADREAAAASAEAEAARNSSTRATRTRTRAVSDETRALLQQARETDRFILSMQDEIAQRTLSEEALFDRRVEMERSNAVAALSLASTEAETTALRDQITALDATAATLRELNAEEAARNDLIAERAKIEEAEQNYQDKIKDAAEERIEAQERAAEEAYRREEEQIRDLADIYTTLFTRGVDDVWDIFEKQGLAVIGTLAAQWTLALLSGQSGTAASNNPLAAIFGSAFGTPAAVNDNSIGAVASAASGGGGLAGLGGVFGGGSGAAASLAGPLGLGAAGFALTNLVGSGIGKLTGTGFNSTLGGIGSLISLPLGIVGGLLGGLFGGSDRGSAIISGGGISGYYGNSGDYKDEAGGLAGSVLDSIAKIADALGADLNMSAGQVSIGIRDGNYRVDPQGRGYTKTSKFPDILDFGDDAEAAVAAAIADLLQDGVIEGISQASQNILRSGQDLEKAIEKAILIESVPKLLAQRLDPLGAALDEIDDKFSTLADALREGGASAQQFADAEKLYNLERDEAIARFGEASSTLKDFLTSLEAGSNSPLSLRQQLSNARATLAGIDPETDQAGYARAAQTVLSLSRQVNASSSAFFDDYNAITEQTRAAIASIDGGTSIPEAKDLFSQQTALNTRDIANLLTDTNNLLRQAINDNVIAPNEGAGFRDWIEQQRSFAV